MLLMSMKTSFLLLMALIPALVQAQTVLPLYAGSIPNQRPNARPPQEVSETTGGILRIRNVSVPTLTLYKAPQPNGTAVIICPGGGYQLLAASHEGADVAAALNQMGITAFVLKYRLPVTPDLLLDPGKAPLTDAQQAIRMVRQRAAEWGLRPDRIGIMGFSAGGHLAATAATHTQPIDKQADASVSVRPDFQILIYPVISFQEDITHKGSRSSLLGSNPTAEAIDLYSGEKQVTAQTPPAFLVHAQDDGTVPVENALAYYRACTRHKVPAEMHLYPAGGHGFGLHNTTTPDRWLDRLRNWLISQKLAG